MKHPHTPKTFTALLLLSYAVVFLFGRYTRKLRRNQFVVTVEPDGPIAKDAPGEFVLEAEKGSSIQHYKLLLRTINDGAKLTHPKRP